jgi:hypothetical protein
MAIEDRLEELFMNDANNRRVASVNMPQRPSPWRGVAAFAGAAAIVAITLVAVILGLRGGQQAAAPTATATATATAIPSATSSAPTVPTSSPVKSSPPTVGPTYQSTLGYSVELPSGWRRSDLQSFATPRDDPNAIGAETFTTRTPADEQAAMQRSDTGIGAAQHYTAFVAINRNSRNETAMAYALRLKGAYGLLAVSTEPTTFDGRAGAKTTFKFAESDTQTFYTVYIPEGDRMWVMGYYLAQSGAQIPPGATEPAVRSIVESFKFAR